MHPHPTPWTWLCNQLHLRSRGTPPSPSGKVALSRGSRVHSRAATSGPPLCVFVAWKPAWKLRGNCVEKSVLGKGVFTSTKRHPKFPRNFHTHPGGPRTPISRSFRATFPTPRYHETPQQLPTCQSSRRRHGHCANGLASSPCPGVAACACHEHSEFGGFLPHSTCVSGGRR